MGAYDKLKKQAKENGGITAATLEELRVALGQRRLGTNVLKTVARQLHADGLDYFPAWVIDANNEPRKTQSVRLVLRDPGSAIYTIVQAVQEPSPDGDDVLRGLESNGSSPTSRIVKLEDQLQRVRDALEDALDVLREEGDGGTDVGE